MKFKIVNGEGCIHIVVNDNNYFGSHNGGELNGEIVEFPDEPIKQKINKHKKYIKRYFY